MDMSTESIVGRTIAKVELSQDKEILWFTFADGSHQVWTAVGDCCSHSWFESVEAFDFAGTVLRVEHADGADLGSGDDYGVTRLYFTTVYTDRGRLCIEMRNQSNGYYGGWIQVGTAPTDQYGGTFDAPTVWSAVQ